MRPVHMVHHADDHTIPRGKAIRVVVAGYIAATSSASQDMACMALAKIRNMYEEGESCRDYGRSPEHHQS